MLKYQASIKYQGKILSGTTIYGDRNTKRKKRRVRECETNKQDKTENKKKSIEKVEEKVSGEAEDNLAESVDVDNNVETANSTETVDISAETAKTANSEGTATTADSSETSNTVTESSNGEVFVTRVDESIGAETTTTTTTIITRISVTTSGDDLAKQPAILPAEVRAGLQRAYLEGIEYMRLKVKETEEELTQIKLGFYQCEVAEEEKYEEYLIKCNEQFLQGNNELRRKNVKLKVIDSEIELVSLLNQLRDKCEVDRGEIAFLSEFWENMKSTMESIKVLVAKFKTSVVDRLRGNCISYNNTEIHLEVSQRYTDEVANYLAEIEKTLNDTLALIQSFANGIHQELFSHTKFTEGILVACDLKAFPILRLFPDLTEKVEAMCATAFVWLDRDERYMYEIHDYIRETRTMAKKRVEDLKIQKEKMKKFEKAVKSANILLHNNKEKLEKLEADLNQLEQTFNIYKQQMESKHGEKSQKESMVDFLKITLSQTKKNYNLQLKRQRLLKQVTELEEFLKGLERDLSGVQSKIQEKSQQKDMLSLKLETSEKSYGSLKTDLDSFTDNLEKLEQEVNGLSGQLLQLEIIQTFKSSPENLDGVFDRPQSVKLAPSLKEKIKRKRKIMPPVH